jgi:hypothetical protein
MVTAVALHGVVDDAPESWRSWFEFGIEQGAAFGFPITHLGLRGGSFQSGKLLNFNRARSRVLRDLSAGESLEWFTLYSLPANFSSALDFEYMAERDRTHGYVVISVRGGKRALREWVKTADELTAHIKAERGEVFAMDQREYIGGYLSRRKRLDAFKTLRVLKKL